MERIRTGISREKLEDGIELGQIDSVGRSWLSLGVSCAEASDERCLWLDGNLEIPVKFHGDQCCLFFVCTMNNFSKMKLCSCWTLSPF
jgi:hypothetical protein